MNGVICLGRVHEVNLLDTLEHLVKIQLQPFPKCVVANDLDAFMKWSVSNTGGMKLCNEEMISSFYNTINRVGGYKRLIFRRGLQKP